MRVLLPGLFVIAAIGAGPALAQGFPGSTVGLTASGLPSNPFASNYPSEPPPLQARRQRNVTPSISRHGGHARRGVAVKRPAPAVPRTGSAR